MANSSASTQQSGAPAAARASETLESFSAAAREASGDVLANWRSGMQAPAELMVENLQFLSHRLLAHASFIEELASCRDVGQVTAKHAAFVSSTLEDYRRQSEVVARKLTAHQPTPRQKR